MTHPLWRDSVSRLEGSLARAWEPRPNLTVSQLAERHLYLSAEYSKQAGYCDFELYPYLREPADRLSPEDPCRVVVFEGPIQGGKSVIGQAFLTAIIVAFPGPTLWVTDTDLKAELFAKKRFELMVRDDPKLRELVDGPKSRTKNNTIKHKTFPGGDLDVVGAQSASGLTSNTFRFAIIDEADDHKANISYAGSSIALAMGRQTTFGEMAKTLIVSSPKRKGDSEIEPWFERGDQRRLWVPCPHCGEFQRLRWRDPDNGEYRLRWPPGHPDEAYYICALCGTTIQNHQKNVMLPAGEWRPERPDLGEDGVITSYRLNALYLPVGSYSWSDAARQWDSAIARLKAGDCDEHRTFINTRLAETYEEPGDIMSPDPLVARAQDEGWSQEGELANVLPEGVRVITLGADVQDDRIELEVVGWGIGLESWSLGYFVIPTDPLDKGTWRNADEILLRRWRRASGEEAAVAAACFDSGFRTQAVYDFVRTRERRRVFATKGKEGPSRAIWDKKVRRGGKNKDKGRFRLVGTDAAKDALQAYLRVTRPGPKYCHFPLERDPDYFAQLTAEKRTKGRDRRGREVVQWTCPDGRRNEALDCRVLALAALHSLLMSGLRLDAPASHGPVHGPAGAPLPASAPPAPAAPPPPAFTPARPARPARQPSGGREGDWFGSGGGGGRGGDWF